MIQVELTADRTKNKIIYLCLNAKNEFYDIISGKNEVRFGAVIQTITGYLGHGSQTSAEAQDTKLFKKQEAERLEHFISQNDLWLNDIDFTQYVSEGAAQFILGF